jgi:ribosomal protein L11 methyltransferase
MEYIEVRFETTDETAKEIFTALLANIGFDSFTTEDNDLKAYIPKKDFDKETLDETIEPLPFEGIEHTITTIPDKNWNEVWEQNYFSPIFVDGKCLIHSTFHKDLPDAKYDITIDPKMAFGTGHHATTSLVISEILKMDVKEKSVLDMGCGTGVLAILSSMKGATPIMAIDIDQWSYDNTLDNMSVNGIDNISVKCGDASLLSESEKYNIVLANINRNILLEDMPSYIKSLHKNGTLIMSGFYKEDLPLIQERAKELGLEFISHHIKENWTVATFLNS